MKQLSKRSLIFTLFASLVLTVQGRKFIFPFEIVISKADLIVIGQIDTLKLNSYTFKINETIKGIKLTNITVEKFKPWLCDPLLYEYKTGQKFCLFLKMRLTHWSLINASTGELLISNDSVTLKYEEYTAQENDFIPYKLSVNELKSGIIEFCKCYKFIGKYYRFKDEPSFRQKCCDQKIIEFKKSSQFATWLNAKMSDYVIRKRWKYRC